MMVFDVVLFLFVFFYEKPYRRAFHRGGFFCFVVVFSFNKRTVEIYFHLYVTYGAVHLPKLDTPWKRERCNKDFIKNSLFKPHFSSSWSHLNQTFQKHQTHHCLWWLAKENYDKKYFWDVRNWNNMIRVSRMINFDFELLVTRRRSTDDCMKPVL